MVQCTECGESRALPSTGRGLCAACDPDADTSQDAVIAAFEAVKQEDERLRQERGGDR